MSLRVQGPALPQPEPWDGVLSWRVHPLALSQQEDLSVPRTQAPAKELAKATDSREAGPEGDASPQAQQCVQV